MSPLWGCQSGEEKPGVGMGGGKGTLDMCTWVRLSFGKSLKIRFISGILILLFI